MLLDEDADGPGCCSCWRWPGGGSGLVSSTAPWLSGAVPAKVVPPYGALSRSTGLEVEEYPVSDGATLDRCEALEV